MYLFFFRPVTDVPALYWVILRLLLLSVLSIARTSSNATKIMVLGAVGF